MSPNTWRLTVFALSMVKFASSGVPYVLESLNWSSAWVYPKNTLPVSGAPSLMSTAMSYVPLLPLPICMTAFDTTRLSTLVYEGISVIAKLPLISTFPNTRKNPSRTTTLPFSNTATLESVPAVTPVPTVNCLVIVELVDAVLPSIVNTLEAVASTENLSFVVLKVSVANTFVLTTLPRTVTRF